RATSSSRRSLERALGLPASRLLGERVQHRRLVNRCWSRDVFTFDNGTHRTAQDLARPGFGQRRDDINIAEGRHRPKIVSDLGHELSAKLLSINVSIGGEYDVSHRFLSLDLIGNTDHGGLCYGRVFSNDRFQRPGGEPV